MSFYPAKVTSSPLWTPEFISPTAWYDVSDEDTITRLGTTLRGQLGIFNPTGTNPFTGVAWQAGDPYRLIFVTAGVYDALSTDINDYNDIVQAEAEAFGLGQVTWKAVVSTATVDARDNTNSRIGVDYDGPTYNMNSVLIAEKLSKLYSGSAADFNAKPDYHGNRLFVENYATALFDAYGGVWSGSQTTGVALNPVGGSSVDFGITLAEKQYWLRRGNSTGPDALLYLYCMSPVLTVQSVDRVSQLDDKVGTNHLLQATEANRPTIGHRYVNGLNCLNFQTDEDLDFTSTIDMLNKTAFFVMITDTYDQEQVENNGNDTQTRVDDTKTHSDGNAVKFVGSDQTTDYGTGLETSEAMSQLYAHRQYVVGWAYGTTLYVYRDGRVEAISDRVATSNAINTIRFGSYQGSSAFLNGALCEYVIASSAISMDDRLRITGYLAHKWGCTDELPDTHPYKTLEPRAGLPVVSGSWTPDDADLEVWLDLADSKRHTNSQRNNGIVNDRVFLNVDSFTAPDQVVLKTGEGDVTGDFPVGAKFYSERTTNAANRGWFEVEARSWDGTNTTITTVETTLVTEASSAAQISYQRIVRIYNRAGVDAADETYQISTNTNQSRGQLQLDVLNGYSAYDNESGGYTNPSNAAPSSGDYGILMVVRIKDGKANAYLRRGSGGAENFEVNPDNGSGVIRINTTSNSFVDFATAVDGDGEFHIIGIRFDFTGDGEFTGRLDGIVDTGIGTYSTKLDFTGGRWLSSASGTGHPHVEIAEYLEFGDASEANFEKLEGYLAWKWGLE